MSINPRTGLVTQKPMVRVATRTTTQGKREQPRGSHLEKEDSQERELCVEKKIKR